MAAIALPAELTMAEASVTLQALLPAIAAADAPPVIDASTLQILDSAAIAVLLECRRASAAIGRELKVEGLPDKALALARLYGVAGLLTDVAAD
ncbi:MAG: STAS domain-containing protein [Burkholderiaceae bacterium]|jgi:phospholipid transport system transporter-binding protein|nr:STAS domain-containing protein [Aquabacterium sp.]NUP84707.1 STAS domain-containing protein [Burkholderiaceae bacterium]